MRKIILITLILILLPGSVSAALERDMSLSFDGEIDYISQTGSDIAETVIVVKGAGSGEVNQTANVTSESLNHTAEVNITSARPWGIEAITGVKLNGNHYVQRVAPDIGQSGQLDQSVEASLDTFTALVFDGLAEVTGGVYQRHVELTNEGISLKEVLKVVGKGEAKDMIRFVPDEE